MDTTERSKLRAVGIEGREIKIPPDLAKISTRFQKHLELQTEKNIPKSISIRLKNNTKSLN